MLEDQPIKSIEIEWLLQSGRDMEHPRLSRRIAPATQNHHRYAREVSMADLLGPEIPPVHPRHFQIEKYDAGHDDTEEIECLVSIGRFGDLEAL